MRKTNKFKDRMNKTAPNDSSKVFPLQKKNHKNTKRSGIEYLIRILNVSTITNS